MTRTQASPADDWPAYVLTAIMLAGVFAIIGAASLLGPIMDGPDE